MSAMQTQKLSSAVGASWSTGIHCPRCHADAAPTNRGRMPKWRCSDEACTFHLGWRLRPSNGQVFAVPVGEDADADPVKDPKLRRHAVPWHVKVPGRREIDGSTDD
jgi:hypothetical protein